MKILSLISIICLSVSSFAGNVEYGKDIAARCVACHGTNGIAPNPAWPSLAGQNSMYIVSQLKKFKQGTRPDPIMGPLSKALSDQDMEDVAAYYQSLGK